MDKKLSMVDIAFNIMKDLEEPADFFELWRKIVEIKEFTEEEADARQSNFYTNITLDGRFITVGENCWDLRERHKFDEVHIDMNDIYSEEEKDDDEDEDDSIEEDDYTN